MVSNMYEMETKSLLTGTMNELKIATMVRMVPNSTDFFMISLKLSFLNKPTMVEANIKIKAHDIVAKGPPNPDFIKIKINQFKPNRIPI